MSTLFYILTSRLIMGGIVLAAGNLACLSHLWRGGGVCSTQVNKFLTGKQNAWHSVNAISLINVMTTPCDGGVVLSDHLSASGVQVKDFMIPMPWVWV